MEDLVAVEVTTSGGRHGWFVTWGRVQHVTDPAPLERLVLETAREAGLPEPAVSARLCTSLGEASAAPFFYEALFRFARQPIPFGRGYRKWRKATARQMGRGRDIWFAGLEPGPAEPG